MHATMIDDRLSALQDKVTALDTKMERLLGLVSRNPDSQREWYSVEETANMFNKSAYTVREWCRLGRIQAVKKIEKRGGSELWSISAREVVRIKEHGLLPVDPNRNTPGQKACTVTQSLDSGALGRAREKEASGKKRRTQKSKIG